MTDTAAWTFTNDPPIPSDRPVLHADGRSWTGAELAGEVGRVAGLLAARGVRPGDVVGVHLPRSGRWIFIHLATLHLGAVVLPLNETAPSQEARRLAARAGVTRLVSDDPDVSDLPGSAFDVPHPPAPPFDAHPDAVAILCFTSGTTGQPKLVPLTRANLRATLGGLHAAWRWTRDDVLLHALPLFHIHGLIVALHGALFAGASIVLAPRFDPGLVHDLAQRHRATVYMGVPTHYQRMLTTRTFLPRSLRLATCGSAPLRADVHRAFEAETGLRIIERYGMTEIGIVLSNPVDAPRAGAVGVPVSGATIDIRDEAGGTVAPGQTGQLHVRGPSVFAGYLRDPDASAAVLVDGWMATGDLGFRDADGYVHLVGRAGDMIISGGLNVYPAEVELALAPLLSPEAEFAVFALPDADLGERVCCATTEAVDVDAVVAALRRTLAPYKLPRRWFHLPALPRNAMGKIQRKLLAARCAEPGSQDE